jgi:hypothetical protein
MRDEFDEGQEPRTAERSLPRKASQPLPAPPVSGFPADPDHVLRLPPISGNDSEEEMIAWWGS